MPIQNCMKSAGYESTYYRGDGILCNGGGSGACGSPVGSAPDEKWYLGFSQSDRASIGLGGYAANYSLSNSELTFLGLQVGGPSYKLVTTYSFGLTSDSYGPMLKGSFSLGWLVGADISVAIGFNGIKASTSLGGGTFGTVTGQFPRQQVIFGGGPSLSVGVGKP